MSARDVAGLASEDGERAVSHLLEDAEPYGADCPPEGDGGKKRRPSQAEVLVRTAIENVAELFHDPDGEAFAVIPAGTRRRPHRETWKLRGKGFRSWLVRAFWQAESKPPGSQALADALNVLEGLAVHEGDERPTFVRVAAHEGAIYLDLGREDWSAVEVTAEGWRVIHDPPVRFRRPKSLRPLPLPEDGGDLTRDLRPLVNVPDDSQWALVLTWLVGVFQPRGPFHILSVQGEQGSAKSNLCRVLRQVVDPASLLLRATPKEERDLAVACRSSRVLAYDNLSGMPSWLSDSLCRIATGGGFATRQLYSDDEEALFDLQAPIVLNGIDDMLGRPDLAERSLVLYLPAIPKRNRSAERELDAAFAERWPRILGALLSAVCCSLARVEGVSLESSPRMADAARWATAAEPALGLEPGAVLRAIEAGQEEAIHQGLDAEPVAQALLQLLEELREKEGRRHWSGSPTRLLKDLRAAAEELTSSRSFPKSAAALTNRLTRVAPALRHIGVVIERGRSKRGRTIAIRDQRLEDLFADESDLGAD